MTTISERLREADDWCTGNGTCCPVSNEAADTIDALVAALERAKEMVDTLGWAANVSTDNIESEIDAALALARKEG